MLLNHNLACVSVGEVTIGGRGIAFFRRLLFPGLPFCEASQVRAHSTYYAAHINGLDIAIFWNRTYSRLPFLQPTTCFILFPTPRSWFPASDVRLHRGQVCYRRGIDMVGMILVQYPYHVPYSPRSCPKQAFGAAILAVAMFFFYLASIPNKISQSAPKRVPNR